MDEKQFQSLLKAVNIIEKLKKYSINEDSIINNGYRKYIKLVYDIINNCLTEFESEIISVDYMYSISSTYDRWEIYFIFNEYNLSKIYLTINDGNDVEILINLDSNEINFYLKLLNNEYLIVKFNKNEKSNDVRYRNKIIKEKKKKTVFNNLNEIINDVKKSNIEDDCNFLQKFEESIDEIEKKFGK